MGPAIPPIQTFELVENLPKAVVFAQLCRKSIHLGGIYYVERGLCRSHRKLYESLRPHKCVALSRLRRSRITHYRSQDSSSIPLISNEGICFFKLAKSINRNQQQQIKVPNNQHGFHQANSCLFRCHRRMRRHGTRSSSQRWLQLLSTYANPCLNILTIMPDVSMKSLAHLLSFANCLKNSTKYQPRRWTATSR